MLMPWNLTSCIYLLFIFIDGPEIWTKVDVAYSSYLFLANITCMARGLPSPKVCIVYKNSVMSQGLVLAYHLMSGKIGENYGNFSCVASNFVKTVSVSRFLLNKTKGKQWNCAKLRAKSIMKSCKIILTW